MKRCRRTFAITLMACIVSFSMLLDGCARGKPDQKRATYRVKAGDVELACKTYGSGKPLVMIMGYGGTMDAWSPEFIFALSLHYKVIIFDNRGMGGSTTNNDLMTIESLADDASSLLDGLGLASAHVLGYSMGSDIAQELALRHPEKVGKLILYGASPGGREAMRPRGDIERELFEPVGTPEERAERFVGLLFPDEWLKRHRGIVRDFARLASFSRADIERRQADAMKRWPGTYTRLGALSQPTLLITGSDDLLRPPANSAIMAEKIPSSWLVQLKGGGHGIMFQRPSGMARIIGTFLEAE